MPVTISGGLYYNSDWRTNYGSSFGFIAGMLAATVVYFPAFFGDRFVELEKDGGLCTHNPPAEGVSRKIGGIFV